MNTSMNKIYLVMHSYETDGGFGDAVDCEDIIAAYTDLKRAEDYVLRWNSPCVYDSPYADLHCGKLFIRELSVDSVSIDTNPLADWRNGADNRENDYEDDMDDGFDDDDAVECTEKEKAESACSDSAVLRYNDQRGNLYLERCRVNLDEFHVEGAPTDLDEARNVRITLDHVGDHHEIPVLNVSADNVNSDTLEHFYEYFWVNSGYFASCSREVVTVDDAIRRVRERVMAPHFAEFGVNGKSAKAAFHLPERDEGYALVNGIAQKLQYPQEKDFLNLYRAYEDSKRDLALVR